MMIMITTAEIEISDRVESIGAGAYEARRLVPT